MGWVEVNEKLIEVGDAEETENNIEDAPAGGEEDKANNGGDNTIASVFNFSFVAARGDPAKGAPDEVGEGEDGTDGEGEVEEKRDDFGEGEVEVAGREFDEHNGVIIQ